MNAPTIVILLVVVVLAGLALRTIIKDKKSGKGCSGCSGSCDCCHTPGDKASCSK